MTTQIAFCSIEKRVPGAPALVGSCHALMGENGAGKSTLGKILAGIYRPDRGHLEIDGVTRRFRSPLEARQTGVSIVHQESALCPNLSVAENLCLSALPRRRATVHRAELLAKPTGSCGKLVRIAIRAAGSPEFEQPACWSCETAAWPPSCRVPRRYVKMSCS